MKVCATRKDRKRVDRQSRLGEATGGACPALRRFISLSSGGSLGQHGRPSTLRHKICGDLLALVLWRGVHHA